MEPTPRGADVVRRARQLGLTAEYVGPTVFGSVKELITINGRIGTVGEADAYLLGYVDGAGRAAKTRAAGRDGSGEAAAC